MYTIKCDDYFLHNANLGCFVINGSCELEVNKTGSLTFYVASNHPNKDKIKKLKSEITLYQDDKALFYGRVLNTETDIDDLMYVECEGELSYLIDTIQRNKLYTLTGGEKNNIETYLSDLIDIHNAQVDERKQFKIGKIIVEDFRNGLIFESNCEDTLSLIQKNLIDNFGGYISIRHDGTDRYIDYFNNSIGECSQIIQFGKNIIDIKTNVKGENIYTALIATGKDITLNDVTDGEYDYGDIIKENDYIYSPEYVEKYGWIWKYVNYSDIETTSALLESAITDLKSHIYTETTIELTAIDLHLLDVNIDMIELGNEIQYSSPTDSLGEFMIVNSININIDDPSKTSIRLVLPEQSKNFSQDTITKKVNDNKSKQEKSDNQDEKFNTIYKELGNIRDDVSDLNTDFNKLNDNLNTSVDNINSDISDLNTGLSNLNNGLSNLNDNLNNLNNDLSNFKKSVSDNYAKKTDLSEYAKIVDVNTAFNELATALGGL